MSKVKVEKAQATVRLDPVIYKHVKRLSIEEHRSANNMIAKLVTEAVMVRVAADGEGNE